MDLREDLALAVRRAERKQAVKHALRDLTAEECRAILLELLGEQAISPTNGTAEKTPHAQGRGSSAAPALPTRTQRHKIHPRAASPGTGEGGNRTQRLLAALSSHPHMPFGELAEATYDENSETTRNRVRSLLQALKKRGLVHPISDGKWEVTAK